MRARAVARPRPRATLAFASRPAISSESTTTSPHLRALSRGKIPRNEPAKRRPPRSRPPPPAHGERRPAQPATPTDDGQTLLRCVAAGVRKFSMSSLDKTARPARAARAGTNLSRAYIRLARGMIFFGDLRTSCTTPAPRSILRSVGQGKVCMPLAGLDVDATHRPAHRPTEGANAEGTRSHSGGQAARQAGRQAGRSHQSEAALLLTLAMDQSVGQPAGARVCACSHPPGQSQ